MTLNTGKKKLMGAKQNQPTLTESVTIDMHVTSLKSNNTTYCVLSLSMPILVMENMIFY